MDTFNDTVLNKRDSKPNTLRGAGIKHFSEVDILISPNIS